VKITIYGWSTSRPTEFEGKPIDQASEFSSQPFQYLLSVPVLHPADDEAEGGRGLRLVEELAVRWGYERGGGQAMTWFELRA
jgi:hypothetical protein